MPEHYFEQTLALLERTPATLDALLRGLPEAWIHGKEGENSWSPFEIMAHLIHTERADWMPRVKMVLQSGEAETFERVNREGFKLVSLGRQLGQLLDEFARLRQENLDQLRSLNLRQEDLDRRGRHPAFGPVTLSELLATWATHDLTHLHQISRVMACQYREAVGPWSKYLGVLKCGGHSDPA